MFPTTMGLKIEAETILKLRYYLIQKIFLDDWEEVVIKSSFSFGANWVSCVSSKDYEVEKQAWFVLQRIYVFLLAQYAHQVKINL